MGTKRTEPHWSEDPVFKVKVKEIFSQIPPIAWKVYGWNDNGSIQVTIDIADAHSLIATILRINDS